MSIGNEVKEKQHELEELAEQAREAGTPETIATTIEQTAEELEDLSRDPAVREVPGR